MQMADLALIGILFVLIRLTSKGIAGAIEGGVEAGVSWAWEAVHGKIAWSGWTLNNVAIAAFVYKLEELGEIEPGKYGAPPPQWVDAFSQFRDHLFESYGAEYLDLDYQQCQTVELTDLGIEMAFDWIKDQYGWPLPEH